jgi:hypothetical protein
MPRVGFEPTIPVFEPTKTVHALVRAAPVIGYITMYIVKYLYGSLGTVSVTASKGVSRAQRFNPAEPKRATVRCQEHPSRMLIAYFPNIHFTVIPSTCYGKSSDLILHKLSSWYGIAQYQDLYERASVWVSSGVRCGVASVQDRFSE